MSIGSSFDASIPNIEVSFSIKIMYFKEENKFIHFQLWDTVGEERFRTIFNNFYNADVIILVYDITNRDSFIRLKEYWIKGIKDNDLSNVSNVSKIISFLKYIYTI